MRFIEREGMTLIKENCPGCGSIELRTGDFKGYGSLFKKRAIIKSSEVEADFCLKCGLVLALRVKNPEKFA
jgi:predicted nucleic-acid-binding Zn-ribbon protein